MARKTSGGGTRNPRKGQNTPVEDAEIVAETGGSGTASPDTAGADGPTSQPEADDPTPTGTSSVEATPDGDAPGPDAGSPEGEGASEVEAPAPAGSMEDAADPSLGDGAPGVGDGDGDAWEAVPGALTPEEAGHPEAVEGVRIAAAPDDDAASGSGVPLAATAGAAGTGLVRAPSVDMVPPAGPAPDPAPDEPTAADTPDVVVTPPPAAGEQPTEGEPSRDPHAAGTTGSGVGAASAMAAGGVAAGRRPDADGARTGRGTPPDLDPPHAAPPSGGGSAPAASPSGGGGFLPMVLGGLLAGLIGLGAGWLLFGEGDEPAVAADDLGAEVAELRAQVESLTGEPDLSPLNARIDEVAAGIPTLTEVEERLGAIETALAAPEDVPADDPLAGRLEEVEGRFIEVDSLAGAVGELREQFATLAAGLADAGEGTAASAAGREALGQEITSAARRLDALASDVEALSSGMEALSSDTEATADEITALRQSLAGMDALNARLDEIAAGAEATRADLDALAAERDRLVAEAEAEAAGARAEAALERLRAAVDAGAPFAEPLAAYEEASGETVPEALAASAEEGVPSLAQLQDEWQDAARAALAEAPAEPGPGGFLRAQLGIRSLNAREGDSADAILSRAEVALGDGDLEGALSEIENLSESPRAALDPWVAEAEERLAATEALAEIDPEAGSGPEAPPASGEADAGTSAEDAPLQEAAPAEEASAQEAPAPSADAPAPEATAAEGEAAPAEAAPSGDAASIDASDVEASAEEPAEDPAAAPAASITPASE